jgi:hypothetical protein
VFFRYDRDVIIIRAYQDFLKQAAGLGGGNRPGNHGSAMKFALVLSRNTTTATASRD